MEVVHAECPVCGHGFAREVLEWHVNQCLDGIAVRKLHLTWRANSSITQSRRSYVMAWQIGDDNDDASLVQSAESLNSGTPPLFQFRAPFSFPRVHSTTASPRVQLHGDAGDVIDSSRLTDCSHPLLPSSGFESSHGRNAHASAVSHSVCPEPFGPLHTMANPTLSHVVLHCRVVDLKLVGLEQGSAVTVSLRTTGVARTATITIDERLSTNCSCISFIIPEYHAEQLCTLRVTMAGNSFGSTLQSDLDTLEAEFPLRFAKLSYAFDELLSFTDIDSLMAIVHPQLAKQYIAVNDCRLFFMSWPPFQSVFFFSFFETAGTWVLLDHRCRLLNFLLLGLALHLLARAHQDLPIQSFCKRTAFLCDRVI